MRVNRKRTAVVIGKGGETKRLVESLTRTLIDVDSKSGEVTIRAADSSRLNGSGENPPTISIKSPFGGEDLESLDTTGSFNIWVAENIIRAINRGFHPQKALKLLSDEYVLEIFDLEALLGRSQKATTRIKGRIIGEHGKMRRAIEQYSNAFLSVFGNTVGIIGRFEDLQVARKSVQMLIQGTPHKTVYAYLQRKYKEKKDDDLRKLWRPTF